MNARSILRFGARIFFVRRKLVFDARLDEIPNVAARTPVRFRFGDAADLMRLSARTHDYDTAATRFSLDRLLAGDRFVIAESAIGSRDEVLFYGWLMFGQLDMGVRTYLPLASDSVYSYRLFTAASHRGKKLCAAYFTFIREQLEAEGHRRVLSWVEARNLISRRVHEAAGFRSIGCIWHIQFLFRSYFYVPKTLRASLRRSHAEHTSSALAAGAGVSRA
jgi:acetyltransferase (GNAT) family protein